MKHEIKQKLGNAVNMLSDALDDHMNDYVSDKDKLTTDEVAMEAMQSLSFALSLACLQVSAIIGSNIMCDEHNTSSEIKEMAKVVLKSATERLKDMEFSIIKIDEDAPEEEFKDKRSRFIQKSVNDWE